MWKSKVTGQCSRIKIPERFLYSQIWLTTSFFQPKLHCFVGHSVCTVLKEQIRNQKKISCNTRRKSEWFKQSTEELTFNIQLNQIQTCTYVCFEWYLHFYWFVHVWFALCVFCISYIFLAAAAAAFDTHKTQRGRERTLHVGVGTDSEVVIRFVFLSIQQSASTMGI